MGDTNVQGRDAEHAESLDAQRRQAVVASVADLPVEQGAALLLEALRQVESAQGSAPALVSPEKGPLERALSIEPSLSNTLGLALRQSHHLAHLEAGALWSLLAQKRPEA